MSCSSSDRNTCPCNNELRSHRSNDFTGRHAGEHSYPGGIATVGQMWSDVTYTSSNNFITSILWGSKWTNLPSDELTWTINYGDAGISSIDIYDNPSNNVALITPTSATEAAVQTCMDDLAKIIGISIRKVTSIDDAILSFNFINNSSISFLGMAVPPTPSNDSYYDTDRTYTSLTDSFWCSGNMYIGYSTSMNFQKGNYNYITIVHELGHAIGLAHPHDTGGNSSVFTGVTSAFNDFGTYGANLQPLTIMTYNDTQSPYVPDSTSSVGFLGTFGPIDVVALQFMYGPNTTATDTIYTFPTSSDNRFWETLWDSGGTDTIDASGVNVAVTINLNDATVAANTQLAGITLSSNLYGGFTIANGATIENVITGTGNDTITGNEADNQVTITEGGTDTIDGGTGFDTVVINNDSTNFTISYNTNTGYIDVTDGTNLIRLVNCEKIIFNDTEVLTNDLFFVDASFNTICEFGTITLNHRWKTVSLTNTYTSPVVITSDPSFRGGDFCSVRLRNISSNSFQIRLDEPKYLDRRHTNETLSYIVGEKGSWTVGSHKMVLNTFSTNKLSHRGGFVTKYFEGSFDATPNLFTTIQTFVGSDLVVTRTKDITVNGFKCTMQEEEKKNRGSHTNETIGYMAIETGNYTIGDIVVKSGQVSNVTHRNKSVSYNSSFSSTPSLMTGLLSYRGGDTSNTRIVGQNTAGFTVKIHEEKSRDREIRHTNETVAYLALL